MYQQLIKLIKDELNKSKYYLCANTICLEQPKLLSRIRCLLGLPHLPKKCVLVGDDDDEDVVCILYFESCQTYETNDSCYVFELLGVHALDELVPY